MVGRALGPVAVLAAILAEPLAVSAEDSSVFSGTLDSSYNLLSPGDEGAWESAGILLGHVDWAGGNRTVKPEIRLNYLSYPTPSVTLDRAWTKFRIADVRGTVGRGRLGWGPGFVYDAGDLLFDSTSPTFNLQSDELRSDSAWLADLSYGLGEEGFVESEVRVADGTARPAAGLRVSQVFDGVTGELAYAADGVLGTHKVAVSTQFHAGLDWYGSVRMDLPFPGSSSVSRTPREHSSVGAFGLTDLGGGVSVTTRHEALLPPGGDFRRVTSYHDVAVSLPEDVEMEGTVLVTWSEPSAEVIGQVFWGPLQNFRLYVRGTAPTGTGDETYSWKISHMASIGVGAVSVW